MGLDDPMLVFLHRGSTCFLRGFFFVICIISTPRQVEERIMRAFGALDTELKDASLNYGSFFFGERSVTSNPVNAFSFPVMFFCSHFFK